MNYFKAAAAISATLFLSGCMSFFYYPSKKNFFDPLRAGLLQEEVDFQTSSGDTVHAWWFRSFVKPSKGTIVFFHGNAENITSHFASLAWIPKEGYSYLIFDYPGYGRSSGTPTPKSTIEAGKAAIDWVHGNKDQGPLIIIGQSLGGNIALKSLLDLNGKFPLKAIVIDCSFPSYQKIAAGKLSQSWITWILQPLAYVLISDEYAPKGIQRLAPTPMLVIHGQKDVTVEPEYGDQIYAMAGEPKQMWKIPDGTHGSTFWSHDRVYQKKLVEYLSALDGAGKH